MLIRFLKDVEKNSIVKWNLYRIIVLTLLLLIQTNALPTFKIILAIVEDESVAKNDRRLRLLQNLCTIKFAIFNFTVAWNEEKLISMILKFQMLRGLEKISVKMILNSSYSRYG